MQLTAEDDGRLEKETGDKNSNENERQERKPMTAEKTSNRIE